MKQTTEIVFLLDASGSMSGLETDTIGGFNATIASQKKEEGTAYVSTVLFNTHQRVLHNRVNLETVLPLSDREYHVGGGTALLDALGGAIDHIGSVHRMLGDERPSKTIFIITTDGMENSSSHYSYKKVKDMVQKMKHKYDWEFIFLGANIDAIAEAERFGIQKEYASNYIQDEHGTELYFNSISKAISNVRMNCELTASWKEEVEKDYAKRKNS